MTIKASIYALRAICASVILFIVPAVFAQAPTAYQPGDTLSFTIKFDGAGIEKLTGAQVHLDLTSPVQDDQKSFLTYINANAGNPASPGVFEATAKIPDYIASGTYVLHQVSTGTAYVGFSYRENLPTITITVVNHEHFTEPTLKSVEKTSHP